MSQRPGPLLTGRRVWMVPLGVLFVYAVSFWVGRQQAAREAPKVRVVTGFPGREAWPALAPDGTIMAFSWAKPDGSAAHIYLLKPQEKEPLQLTSGPGSDYAPVWSLDGSKLAFWRIEGSGASVWTMNAGGAPRQFRGVPAVPLEQYGRPLAWTPDAKAVVLPVWSPELKTGQLTRVPVNGGEAKPLTSPAGAVGEGSPIYSPTGKHLAFVRVQGPNASEVFVAPCRQDGTLTGEPKQLTRDDVLVRGLAWAPDGSEIVFSSPRQGGTRVLWRMPVDGGEITRFAGPGEGAFEPTVASRSGAMAYAKQAGNESDLVMMAP